MAQTLLKVDNINVFYGNIHAVKDVSFEVNEGEIVTLIGAKMCIRDSGWDGLEGYATNDQLKDTYFCANYAKGSNAEFEDCLLYTSRCV